MPFILVAMRGVRVTTRGERKKQRPRKQQRKCTEMDLVLPDTTYKREIRQLYAWMVFFTINDNWGEKKRQKISCVSYKASYT